MNNIEANDKEIFLGTNQPETCRHCGGRTEFKELSSMPKDPNTYQLHTCLNTEGCGFKYVVEFKPNSIGITISEAKKLWEELGDIPVDDDGCIEQDWKQFEAGTDREDIWHWFENKFNLSVAEDLMGIGR